MVTYWHNKTKVIVLAILIILWGAICIQKATGGTYTDSIHGGGWTGIDGVDRSTIDAKYSNYADGNCAHCHEKHASLGGSEPAPVDGGPAKRLGFSEEEHLCEECHDGDPVLNDIKTQASGSQRHPIHDTSGKHTLSKLEHGQNGAPFRDTNRHAECCDCHNPHTIGGIDKTTPKIHPTGLSSPQRLSDGNTIYNTSIGTACLQGVWGVEPSSWPGSWTSPTSFIETLPANGYARYAEKEYQICFKCHSYYGLGTSTGDMAREFNPNNKSGHPVIVTQNNRTGSDTPKALPSGHVDGGRWARGECTMYCSDCHGSHLFTGAQGVHGADIPEGETMLRGWRGNFRACWPTDHQGNYWTLNRIITNTAPSWQTYLFCYNCHLIYQPSTGSWTNKAHNEHCGSDDLQYGRCVCCHVKRVHGSEMGRLIGGEIEGYKVLEFRKKSDPSTYTFSDCYTQDSGISGNTCRYGSLVHATPLAEQ